LDHRRTHNRTDSDEHERLRCAPHHRSPLSSWLKRVMTQNMAHHHAHHADGQSSESRVRRHRATPDAGRIVRQRCGVILPSQVVIDDRMARLAQAKQWISHPKGGEGRRSLRSSRPTAAVAMRRQSWRSSCSRLIRVARPRDLSARRSAPVTRTVQAKRKKLFNRIELVASFKANKKQQNSCKTLFLIKSTRFLHIIDNVCSSVLGRYGRCSLSSCVLCACTCVDAVSVSAQTTQITVVPLLPPSAIVQSATPRW
jgi:hypothetical protein